MKNKQAWLGTFLALLPALRAVAMIWGIHLPDLGGLGDIINAHSMSAVGVGLVATADPVQK